MKIINNQVVQEVTASPNLRLNILELLLEAKARKLYQCKFVIKNSQLLDNLEIGGDKQHPFEVKGFDDIVVQIEFQGTSEHNKKDIVIFNECQGIYSLVFNNGHFDKIILETWKKELAQMGQRTLNGIPPKYVINESTTVQKVVCLPTVQGVDLYLYGTIDVLLSRSSKIFYDGYINHCINLNDTADIVQIGMRGSINIYGKENDTFIFGDKAISFHKGISKCIRLNELYPTLWAENVDDKACMICI